jgi:type IV pilus assembly protein PilB
VSERLRLGDMLVAAGLVTEAQVHEALARQRTTGERLGLTLVALGCVTESQMTQVLSNQLSIPWANLYHVDFSRELLDLVPAELATRYCMIPVYVRHVRRQGDTLYVAMEDPLNLDAFQAAADAAGMPVKPMVASPSDIENAIRVYYLGLEPLSAASKPRAGARDLPESEELDLAEELGEELADAADAGTDTDETEAAVPEAREPAAEQREPELEREGAPAIVPSQPPPPSRAASRARFLTLTLLDGTEVRLPAQPKPKAAAPVDEGEPEAKAERGLTTRDLIHALTARAAGEDVSNVISDDDWESLFAALLSILLRKGLVADWEFVDEWKKHRER